MSWTVSNNGGVVGLPSPTRALRVNLKAEWAVAEEKVELFAVRYSATLYKVHWIEQVLAIGTPGESMIQLGLHLPWDRETIEQIEDARGGGGPLSFTIELSLQYRAIGRYPQAKSGDWFLFGRPTSQNMSHRITIQRDEWLTILKAIKWDEFAVYEIPARAMLRHEDFKRSFEKLDHAETAFRQGQWDTVIDDVRKACEFAATAVDPKSIEDGKTGAAFVTLAKLAFPDDTDEVKRDALDHALLAIGAVRGDSAHGKNPKIQWRREDAEFAFAMGMAAFKYLGEALARSGRE